jgi:hypothetical protein
MEANTIKNKIILFAGNLWIIDDVREGILLISKLESDAEVVEFDLDDEIFNEFCFEQARLDAVDVMNQTRYYDNVLSKERDNTVD